MKKYCWVVIVTSLMLCCSKDDDTIILAPDLDVVPVLNTSFFQAGEGPLPEVKWNGNQGKFGLENTLQGLAVDAETGQLSWDSSLPTGTHTIVLFAYNKAGKDVVALTINNRFQGTFRGTFQSRTTFSSVLFRIMEISFNPDGTFSGYEQQELNNGNVLGPNYFNGNYTISQNKLEGTLQFEESESVNPWHAELQSSSQNGQMIGSYTNTSFLDQETTFELNIVLAD